MAALSFTPAGKDGPACFNVPHLASTTGYPPPGRSLKNRTISADDLRQQRKTAADTLTAKEIKPTPKDFVAPRHASSHLLHSIPTRGNTCRQNIIDYLIHLNLEARFATIDDSTSLVRRAEQAHREPENRKHAQHDDLVIPPLDSERADGLEKLVDGMLSGGRHHILASIEARLPPAPASLLNLGEQTEMPTQRSSALHGAKRGGLVSATSDQGILELGKHIETRWRLVKILNEVFSPTTEVDQVVSTSDTALPGSDDKLVRPTSSVSANSIEVQTDRSARLPSYKPIDILPLSVQALVPVSSPEQPHSELRGSKVSQALLKRKFSQVGSGSTRPAHVSPPSQIVALPADKLIAPHIDYRINHKQAIRARAAEIFSASVPKGVWCRNHRMRDCTVCPAVQRSRIHSTQKTRKDAATGQVLLASRAPGAGLGSAAASETHAPGTQRLLLAEIIPEFIIVSEALFGELAEMMSPPTQHAAEEGTKPEWELDLEAGEDRDAIRDRQQESAKASASQLPKEPPSRSGPADRAYHVYTAWYDLFANLSTQAMLQGFVMESWKGYEAGELLLGVGCGGWHGRGWGTAYRAREPQPASELLDLSEEEQEDLDEGSKRRLKKEVYTQRVVTAAKLLFGVRNNALARYETKMHDRTQEFLTVKEGSTLEEHLDQLCEQYSYADCLDELSLFLQSAQAMMGKPELAKYEALHKLRTKGHVTQVMPGVTTSPITQTVSLSSNDALSDDRDIEPLLRYAGLQVEEEDRK
ncbi:uncharacterized protein L969DRAFT_84165 [Mixia osmundae IAM 14324]|uniref:Uncharacterized protein n=1 Tax=Mixia osmundae (strain CBS 9802 / IAM 14324 / JCM 22182 / KY 12970) TaxID=764103 RepID=G7EAF9_MIXOS|nr:uncharacterized protein L969DRAFT_84165 [Mixia osmundae IAM 14324]KEI42309.1 hypothetical protein L969DRAFT_84165 [Mixia osmundae IAM 14324]GAA99819.1 hypothetical protein E5Q_06522 [Mixia osmundae IAM 14324]